LNAIPEQDINKYGFSNIKEMDQATLGNPFRVYTLSPEKIINYQKSHNFSSAISPTTMWFFPVLCNGAAKTLLTVDFMGDEWRAVAIGSSGLAKQLGEVIKKWPESEGYGLKFVRVFQARSDLIALSHEGKVKIKPLNSAEASMQLGKKGISTHERLYDTSEIMQKLSPVVIKNIKGHEIY
jgi:hypothetical protein